ncbi:hypothetical protein GCM10009555_067410 [Acrocarpospora macrocephala]
MVLPYPAATQSIVIAALQPTTTGFPTRPQGFSEALWRVIKVGGWTEIHQLSRGARMPVKAIVQRFHEGFAGLPRAS